MPLEGPAYLMWAVGATVRLSGSCDVTVADPSLKLWAL